MLAPHAVFTRLVACWLVLSLVLVALPVPASARTFTNPVHEKVQVTGKEYWEEILVNASEKLVVNVRVLDGDAVKTYTIEQSNLASALSGQPFEVVKNSTFTRNYSFTLIRSGTFAIFIQAGSHPSNCTVDIEVMEATYFELVLLPLIIIIVVSIVAIVVFVLVWKWTRKGGSTVITKKVGLDGVSAEVKSSREWKWERKGEFSASYAFCSSCFRYVKGETGSSCPRCGKTL